MPASASGRDWCPVSRRARKAQTAAAPGTELPIWSAEYWANKGNVTLNLWRKRVGAPKPGEPPLPVLFLVHGSSNSTRSSYDLTVPGKGEYSFMNVFARHGYDVWTMDHDGYGHSGSSGNNSDIASGVEDLKAAIPVVVQETGQQQDAFLRHLVGRDPRRRLCAGPAGACRTGSCWSPSPTRAPARRRSRAATRGSPSCAPINRRKRDAAMIRSIFTRDGHASSYDPAVPEAIIAQEMKFGEQIPTGTYLDMAAQSAAGRSEEGAARRC